MGYLTKIAFKNLARHRLRTVVSIAAIAFSVLVVVFARGYVLGLAESAVTDHIFYDSGHIKILHPEYLEQARLLPLNLPVDDLSNLVDAFQKVEGVELVVPRIKFGAMISTGDELFTPAGWGVDPELELAFTDIAHHLAEGRMPRLGQLEIAVGSELAKNIGREVGEKVTIAYTTAFNSLGGATFTIVGLLESGMKLLNEHVFFLPLDEAQRLLYLDNQATELLLVTTDLKSVSSMLPKVQNLLSKQAGDYTALSYRDTSDLIPFTDLAKLIYNQVYVFLVLLAAVVVINTMLMIVKERTQEIGMMAALGLEGKDIVGLFVIEGGIMGAAGSLAGAVLGLVLTKHFGRVGIDYTQALSGMSKDIVLNAVIRPVVSLENAVFAFVLGTIIVTFACVFPARKAASLEPSEAMRSVQ